MEMKTYKIYQINVLKDNFGVCFEPYNVALKLSKKEHIDFSIYELVHEDRSVANWQNDSDLLEYLFSLYNDPYKDDLMPKMRRMSVSDIVEIDGRLYYCEPIGWKEIEV